MIVSAKAPKNKEKKFNFDPTVSDLLLRILRFRHLGKFLFARFPQIEG